MTDFILLQVLQSFNDANEYILELLWRKSSVIKTPSLNLVLQGMSAVLSKKENILFAHIDIILCDS